MDDIMWCLTTLVNPNTDIINPLPGGRGQTFMPAERMTAGEREWTASNTMFEGGMGIDATVPFGYESDFMRPVYPVDKVDLKMVQRQGYSERQVAHAWLGPLFGPHGKIISERARIHQHQGQGLRPCPFF